MVHRVHTETVDDEISIRFATNFRALMERERLTFRDVRARTGIELSTLNRILGLWHNTKLTTAQKLAECFGFDLRDLLEDPKEFKRRLR